MEQKKVVTENESKILRIINKFRSDPTSLQKNFSLTAKFLSRFPPKKKVAAELAKIAKELPQREILPVFKVSGGLCAAADQILKEFVDNNIPFDLHDKVDCKSIVAKNLKSVGKIFELIDEGSLDQILARCCVSEYDPKRTYKAALESKEYKYIGFATILNDDDEKNIIILCDELEEIDVYAQDVFDYDKSEIDHQEENNESNLDISQLNKTVDSKEDIKEDKNENNEDKLQEVLGKEPDNNLEKETNIKEVKEENKPEDNEVVGGGASAVENQPHLRSKAPPRKNKHTTGNEDHKEEVKEDENKLQDNIDQGDKEIKEVTDNKENTEQKHDTDNKDDKNIEDKNDKDDKKVNEEDDFEVSGGNKTKVAAGKEQIDSTVNQINQVKSSEVNVKGENIQNNDESHKEEIVNTQLRSKPQIKDHNIVQNENQIKEESFNLKEKSQIEAKDDNISEGLDYDNSVLYSFGLMIITGLGIYIINSK